MARPRIEVPPAHRYLEPSRLYTLEGFMEAAGISRTDRYQAKREHKIELSTLEIGVRKWVRGKDGIEFMEKLAAAKAVEKAAKRGSLAASD